jgi:putative membrane protein
MPDFVSEPYALSPAGARAALIGALAKLQRARTLSLVAAASLVPSPVFAHEQSLRTLTDVWTWNPWLALTAAISGGLYLRGQVRLRQRRVRGKQEGIAQSARDRLELAAFVLAWLSIMLALMSPLDRVSDVLLSAHMVQHEMLMLLAAPLFALSRPLDRFLWALAPRARRDVAVVLQLPGVRKSVQALSAPASAVVLHAIVRWLWHVPTLFEAALDNEWIHGLQHASFFFTALLFWGTLVHGRYGRLGYGVSMVFVLVTALHTGALGVLISLAREPWYPRYQERAALYGQNALSDQQLAGLLMWIGAGFVLTLLGLALFAAWVGEAERPTLAPLVRNRDQV